MGPKKRFLPPPPPLPPTAQKFPIAMPIPMPRSQPDFSSASASQTRLNQLTGRTNTFAAQSAYGSAAMPVSSPVKPEFGTMPSGLPGFQPVQSNGLSLTTQSLTMPKGGSAPQTPSGRNGRRRTRVGAPNSRLRVADLIDQRMMHRERQRRRQIMAMRQHMALQRVNTLHQSRQMQSAPAPKPLPPRARQPMQQQPIGQIPPPRPLRYELPPAVENPKQEMPQLDAVGLPGFAPPEESSSDKENTDRNMIPTNFLPDQAILMNLALNLRSGRG